MTKNVAADISEKLIDSIGLGLEGKVVGTFGSVRSLVLSSLEESLTRILTPKRHIDVLQGVQRAQAEKRPYSIVFVGVNGVGKSTSLSKICAYLLSKNLKVSIAACDTFRAGAVEQLRTHCTALGVELFEKGYDKDAATVAMEGIANGKAKGHDVVMVDTAGRMQDNEPLMRALAKLIHMNRPDLVLFVGEALVGNDGVDQLVKFNRSLADLSTEQVPRLIDGIVLTKFDTIDDKVGAAISMTYSTGAPIVFVGVGQTYRDLRRMNVKMLIKALLK
jgi:signal recognition particle receptor subunit alpha